MRLRITTTTAALAGMVFLTFSNVCLASTWNTFAKAFNADIALFFFDADTVTKQGDTVTLWIKYVNTRKPENDGSWSTARKYSFSCAKRTAQAFTASVYDKDGKFLRSSSIVSEIRDVEPDSILEEIQKTACASDFPRNKSKVQYYPVLDNNVFEHTRVFIDYVDSQIDHAPK